MTFRRSANSLLFAALVAASGCGAVLPPKPESAPKPTRRTQKPDPHLVSSNIFRGDYAGSAACAGCHAEIFAKWITSPMRNMTRRISESKIHAPFNGKTFRFKGDSVTMEEHEGRKYMRVVSSKSGSFLYRVTKVIGGRYREDFVGYEVSGTEENALPIEGIHKEPVLPVSYLISSGTWRYKGYSVMVKERPYIEKGGASWRQTCILCHNTAPYLTSIYDDLLGGGARAYQGSVSDRLLSDERLWSVHAADEKGLKRRVSNEITYLRGRPPKTKAESLEDVLTEAVNVTRQRFGESHLIEVGVGCEACHNGSKEHVKNPSRKPTFALRSPFIEVEAPNPKRAPGASPSPAEWINHTCARCHTVLFSRYPYTWEGGLRDGSPGGSSINSGEARDYLLGGCTSQMSCTRCHDPHAEDSREKLEALGTVAGNHVCLDCHGRYAGDAALRAHTHHAPDGPGSACLSCHMPKKNAGLDYRLTRYHRIGSPTDKERVERDRPLECALCHADKSVTSLVESMERWWGKSYDRFAVGALYGGYKENNPLYATLARGKPHEQLTAAAVLGERGTKAAAPLLVPLLAHEYPLVRFFARSAIERLVKQSIPLDLDADPAVIRAGSNVWLKEALKRLP